MFFSFYGGVVCFLVDRYLVVIFIFYDGICIVNFESGIKFLFREKFDIIFLDGNLVLFIKINIFYVF